MSRSAYPRYNLFSSNAPSNGAVVGSSEPTFGLGKAATVSLGNAGDAIVVTEYRRVNPSGDSAWSEIGARISVSQDHRMVLQANMQYRWTVIATGFEPVELSLRMAVPTSLEERSDQITSIPYSDGFSSTIASDTSTSSFADALAKNDFFLHWSAYRAGLGTWDATTYPFAMGSDGHVYRLNQNTGGGLPGNQNVDPSSGLGTETSSWISVTGNSDNPTVAQIDAYEFIENSTTFTLAECSTESKVIRHRFDSSTGNKVMVYPDGLDAGTQIDHVNSLSLLGNSITVVFGDGQNEPIYNWKNEVDLSDGALEIPIAGEYSLLKMDDGTWRQFRMIAYDDSEFSSSTSGANP